MDILKIATSRQLQGSEKQIKWAETIRTKKAKEIRSLKIAGIASIIKNEIGPTILMQTGISSVDEAAKVTSQVIHIALRSDQAKQWIDNREMSGADLIKKAALTKFKKH